MEKARVREHQNENNPKGKYLLSRFTEERKESLRRKEKN